MSLVALATTAFGAVKKFAASPTGKKVIKGVGTAVSVVGGVISSKKKKKLEQELKQEQYAAKMPKGKGETNDFSLWKFLTNLFS